MSVLEARKLAIGARIDGVLTPVIRDVSFSLAAGRVLGLVGESGAGKSMIGRAIAQLLPAGFAITAGELRFEGKSLLGLGARQARARTFPCVGGCRGGSDARRIAGQR